MTLYLLIVISRCHIKLSPSSATFVCNANLEKHSNIKNLVTVHFYDNLLYKDSELLFIEKFQLYISGTNIDATEYDFKKALDLLRYIDKVIKADLVYKPQEFSIVIYHHL